MKKYYAKAKTIIEKTKKLARSTTGIATLATLAVLMAYTLLDNRTAPTTNAEMSRTSVKIVKSSGRSGGTGVIIRSGFSESLILTNRHVCNVVKSGGLVITDTDSYAVSSFSQSEEHDLCVVAVSANLGISTKIATKAPSPYSNASISGHPRLLPNIVTRGHFSGKQIIEIMTGLRPCTEADLKGDLGLFCLLLGGVPDIHRFEAQVVSATIQPGSSGSAVFNDRGEVAGLVFAGSGELGYAHIVPFEAIVNFLYRELPTLKKQFPDSSLDLSNASSEKRLREVCASEKIDARMKPICELAARDVVWTN